MKQLLVDFMEKLRCYVKYFGYNLIVDNGYVELIGNEDDESDTYVIKIVSIDNREVKRVTVSDFWYERVHNAVRLETDAGEMYMRIVKNIDLPECLDGFEEIDLGNEKVVFNMKDIDWYISGPGKISISYKTTGKGIEIIHNIPEKKLEHLKSRMDWFMNKD